MAETAIRNAKREFVIGYSCPPTDLSTSFMLQQALMRGQAEVYLFCKSSGPASPSAEELKRRYRTLLGGDESRFHATDIAAEESLLPH